MEKIKNKKVAVILDEMSIGGIPKACASFVNQLSSYCNVTMIMCNEQGELAHLLPKDISRTVIENYGTTEIFKKLAHKKRFGRLLRVGVSYFIAAYIEKRWVKATEIIYKEKEKIDLEHYDCAIAYHGMSITQLTRTLYQVNAKKKIAWIHGDHPFEGIHKKDVDNVYRKFDKIYCVSDMTRQKFLKDFSNLSDITEVYYNLFEVEDIIKKSMDYNPEEIDANKINLVTVGRISKEKGQEMIPKIMELLQNQSEDIQWYVVGDGEDRTRVEQLVKEKEITNQVHFVGAKDNPYPYMLKGTIYVQPSYTEGYPLTIFEAAILEKAIVATDVGGTKESLTDSYDVIFTKPTPDSIAKGIKEMIFNVNKRKQIEQNLKNRDFSNKKEINKLLAFLEE